MKNQIQEIEEELRELAEATEHAANKLAELRKPKRVPKAGDVWTKTRGEPDNYLMCASSPDGVLATNLDSNARTHFGPASQNPISGADFNYLGKFDEVYTLRSDADDELKEVRDWRDSKGFGMDEFHSDDAECANFIYHFLNGSMDEYEPVPPIC